MNLAKLIHFALARLGLVAMISVSGLLTAGIVFGSSNQMIQRIPVRQVADRPDIDGLWRSRGYGWLWSIDDTRIRIYDAGAEICIEKGDEQRSVDEPDLEFRIDPGGRVLRVKDGDKTYDYVFDRIAELPDACRGAPDQTPAGVLNAVDDYFSSHYPFFGQRGIDWPALISAARARLTSDTGQAELFGILSELLSRIPDDHVTLEGLVDGRYADYGFELDRTLTTQSGWKRTNHQKRMRRWKRDYWDDGVANVILHGKGRRAANDKVFYGLIGEDIGYLNIRSMEGFSNDFSRDAIVLAKTLDHALKQFSEARAVIVDVTFNDGGYDHRARQIVARFANARTHAYGKFPGDIVEADTGKRPDVTNARNPAVQNVFIEPSDRARFTGPVYVLTSGLTVSAAEIFTIAMRALPNVTHVGAATRGSLSDLLGKQLPNGWQLSLSNEVYLDSDGQLWEGRGIKPQVEIEVFSDKGSSSGHVEAVKRVVGLARN